MIPLIAGFTILISLTGMVAANPVADKRHYSTSEYGHSTPSSSLSPSSCSPVICSPTATVTVTATVTASTSSSSVAVSSSSTSVSSSTRIVSSSSTSLVSSSTSSLRPSKTPTPGGACLNVNPSCGGSGFDIAYYNNPFGYAGYSSPNSTLDSNYYIRQGLTPLQTSLTNETTFPSDGPTFGAGFPIIDAGPSPNPYSVGYTRQTNGGISVNGNNFTLAYTGLLRAPATGAFQFCATSDNEADLYFGDGSAFSCLNGTPSTSSRPILTAVYAQTPVPCTTVQMTKGFYYPIRTVQGNYAGPSAFTLTLAAPGATDGGSSDFSGEAYPVNCGIYL